MKITKIKKRDNDRWKYQRKLITKQKKEKQEIIRRNHDDPWTGYPEFKEILWKVADIAFWNIMRKNIFRYMQECREYQLEEKSRKQKLRKEIERSEEIWRQVFIDHIIKFLQIKDKDAIIVIQDQFSGMIYIKAVSEKETARQIWQNCWKTAWKLYRTSKEIRTDWGIIFTSRQWKENYQKEEMEHIKTMVYHP